MADGSERLWDFAAPNAGQFLIDSENAGVIPFYELNEIRTVVGNTETVTNEDNPALPLGGPINSVLPAPGDTTQIDVSYDFETFATWEFSDGTVYFLGKTTWNARYAGSVSRPVGGGNPSFSKSENNNNNGSISFSRSNSNPPATSAPVAEDGNSGWW